MKKIYSFIVMALIAINSFAYDTATSGTTYFGSNCAAYGLSDGTVAIYTYYTADGQTEVTYPATIQVYEGETMTAEYEVSAVGVEGWGSTYLGAADKTYQYAGSVTSLVFSEGIKTINASAFYEMTSLKSVTLPKSLTTIGDYAFTSCDALETITSYATTAPTLGADALKGKADWDVIAKNCVLKVPDGCVANYAAYTFDNTKAWSYYDTFYGSNNIHELSYPSITEAGYSTYYNDYGYIMPEGVEGYIVNWTYEGKANLVKVYEPGDEVFAGIALLWKSTTDLDAEKWYTVEALASGGNTAAWPLDAEGNAYTNLLCGTQVEGTTTAWGTESTDYYYYKLANGANGVGWYYGTTEGVAFTNAAHKGYLLVSKSSGAREFVSLGSDVTGIKELKSSKMKELSSEYYDLQGRRVLNPTKGLYIVNGKKVIVK